MATIEELPDNYVEVVDSQVDEVDAPDSAEHQIE
jgi:hypothetical protein